MTTITLNISDNSILPVLLDTLRHFKGVEVCHRTDANSNDNHILSREEGEMLVRETFQQQQFVRESLTRAFSELSDAQSSKRELPDASDLFKLMDVYNKL